MVLKKFYKFIFLFIFATFNVSIHAGVLEVVQGTLALAPCVASLNAVEQSFYKAVGIKPRRSDFFKDASQDARRYVHNELKDLPGIDSMPVIFSEFNQELTYAVSAFGITIGTDPETKRPVLESILAKLNENPNDPELLSQLSEINFVLHHEAAHLKHNDPEKRAAGMIVPIASLVFFFKMQSKMPKVPFKLGFLFKLPAAVMLGLGNHLMTNAYKRRLEQQADDAVPNRKDLLEGGIRFMKKLCENDKKITEFVLNQSKDLPDSFGKKVYAKFCKLIVSDIFASHPSSESRLLKLEQRLKALEKQEIK